MLHIQRSTISFFKKPHQTQEFDLKMKSSFEYDEQSALALLSAVLVLFNAWFYSKGKPKR